MTTLRDVRNAANALVSKGFRRSIKVRSGASKRAPDRQLGGQRSRALDDYEGVAR